MASKVTTAFATVPEVQALPIAYDDVAECSGLALCCWPRKKRKRGFTYEALGIAPLSSQLTQTVQICAG
jgi:hypothetical protein